MPRKFTTNLEVVGQIRREAMAEGCNSMTLFSQASGVLVDAMKDVGKASGLCRSMAIRWLKGRKNGKDFLAELMLPGLQVSTAIVKQMSDEYDALGNTNIDTQTSYIISQLGAAGLVSTGSHRESLTSSNVVSVGSWFTQSSAQSGLGKLRSVNTWGGYSHAMAMDLRERQAIFFDPNWGQFTFPSHLMMVNFLTRSMFTRSGGKHLYADADRGAFSCVIKIGFN